TIPLNDEKTYKLLQSGNVKGVFQLETSPGMREFVIRMKPEVFEDLVALIAMYRPGPLQSGMADAYVNRKKGREKLVYPHDDLAEILGETYGVVLYQEQVMQISQKIGGFSPAKSDDLRKAMGKKKKEKMAELRVEFIEGSAARGYNKDFAAHLYDQMAEFAGYGFNKSHSAAYAMVVYRTAYLKANFPTYYMAAVLDSEIDKTDRLVPYILECREMGLEILGPDINHSMLRFHVEKEGVIRFGLNAIKNVGAQAVESIIEAREREGGFKSFFHFMENTDLRLCNRRTLESMVQAGSFESMNYTRKALIESLDLAVQHAQNHQKDRISGQSSLFDALGAAEATEEPIPRGDDVTEYDETTLLNQEKMVLGIYFSGHPLSKYERFLKSARVIPIEKLGQFDSGKVVEIAAVITQASVQVNKKNNEYCRMTIEDLTGRVDCIVFPKNFEQLRGVIAVDQAFWVKAKIDKNDETGTVQLLVDSLSPLNRESLEEKLERSLHLQISRENLNQKVIQNLVTLFRCHQGPLAVYFHLAANEEEGVTVIRAHESFGVNWNQELQEKLSNIPQVQGAFLTVGEQSRTLMRKEAKAG
ncbi:MAG: DNA polymerase III subunit alpha, partial [Leptospiraceae bacterium]|nr:DNA polymerase III subunit alpha [Leptospiraceae bacterium]